MTTFCDYNIQSLEKSLKEISPEKLEDEFTKELSVKQFADVIESLTAAVFEKSGLHGAQTFLKSLGLVDSKKDYKEEFTYFLREMDSLDQSDYKSPMKRVEKQLGYEFKYKRFLIIALTHSSKKRGAKVRDNFFNCYENLEYLGDVVHKFFVVKRIKSMVDHSQNISKEDTYQIISDLNLKKSAAEANSLLGFICVREKIFEAILHNTPHSRKIKEYSKKVVEEERKARLKEDLASDEIVKIDLNFEQYHVKMLADVIEAIIGAIFLDCLAQDLLNSDLPLTPKREDSEHFEIDPIDR